MVIISSRDFRANQTKYLDMASKGEGVILRTRSLGSFKITPISDDDTIISKDEFFRKLNHAHEEIKAGKGTLLKSKEEIDTFLDTL